MTYDEQLRMDLESKRILALTDPDRDEDIELGEDIPVNTLVEDDEDGALLEASGESYINDPLADPQTNGSTQSTDNRILHQEMPNKAITSMAASDEGKPSGSNYRSNSISAAPPTTRPGAVFVRGMGSSSDQVSIAEDYTTIESTEMMSASDNNQLDLPRTEGMTDEILRSEIRQQVLDEAVAPMAVKRVSQRRGCLKKRSKVLLIVFVLVLCVIGLVLGLVFGLDSTSGSGTSQTSEPENDAVPDLDSVLPTPEEYFISGLGSSPVRSVDVADFEDKTTSQYKAVQWVCQEANELQCLNPRVHLRLFQLYALAAFFYEFGIDDQLAEIVDFDVCSYPGLRCDSEGFVEDLDFSNRNLTGPTMKELGFLDRLQAFDISNNPGFYGAVPVEWGNRWIRLVSFNISFTGIDGTVLPQIGTSSLRYVHFEGTNVSSLELVCDDFDVVEFSANCAGVSDPTTLAGDNLVYCPCCTKCCNAHGMDCVIVE